MKKTFPLQLDLELHRRMKHACLDAGETLRDWVIGAIEMRLQADSIGVQDSRQQKLEFEDNSEDGKADH